jgi:hypothetical protein
MRQLLPLPPASWFFFSMRTVGYGARENTDAVANGNYYGTTLWVYDLRIDAWHIHDWPVLGIHRGL